MNSKTSVMTPKARIEMHVDEFYGENIDMSIVLEGLRLFKSDLEAIGCEVAIVVKQIRWDEGKLPISMTVDIEPAPVSYFEAPPRSESEPG